MPEALYAVRRVDLTHGRHDIREIVLGVLQRDSGPYNGLVNDLHDSGYKEGRKNRGRSIRIAYG